MHHWGISLFWNKISKRGVRVPTASVRGNSVVNSLRAAPGTLTLSRVPCWQGYLAHEKTYPPLGPSGGLREGTFSYERGTPAAGVVATPCHFACTCKGHLHNDSSFMRSASSLLGMSTDVWHNGIVLSVESTVGLPAQETVHKVDGEFGTEFINDQRSEMGFPSRFLMINKGTVDISTVVQEQKRQAFSHKPRK